MSYAELHRVAKIMYVTISIKDMELYLLNFYCFSCFLATEDFAHREKQGSVQVDPLST